MSKKEQSVNTTAPLANVAACMRALEIAMKRHQHLPGIVAFYGHSGWGKTVSAAYAANHYRAYYVEVKSSWHKKALLQAILVEMGVAPRGTVPELTDQVAEHLVLSGRPLIIDEFDALVNRNLVEIVRDIYETSNAPILIIGEERLEVNLRRWERFHNRVLDWVPAQPASLADAKHLRTLYCQRAKVTDDLLARIHEVTRANVRRICINLERAQELASQEHWKEIDLAKWGNREFYTGEAPQRHA
jgi:DNA transposition AAA+ family ATPase